MLIDKFYVLSKPWPPACIYGIKCTESVGEGLICLNALSHPLNCQGLVTKLNIKTEVFGETLDTG